MSVEETVGINSAEDAAYWKSSCGGPMPVMNANATPADCHRAAEKQAARAQINVVLFSGGSGTQSITEAFRRHPQISLKILINAYDDGHSTGRLRRFLPGYARPLRRAQEYQPSDAHRRSAARRILKSFPITGCPSAYRARGCAGRAGPHSGRRLCAVARSPGRSLSASGLLANAAALLVSGVFPNVFPRAGEARPDVQFHRLRRGQPPLCRMLSGAGAGFQPRHRSFQRFLRSPPRRAAQHHLRRESFPGSRKGERRGASERSGYRGRAGCRQNQRAVF